MVNKYVPEVGAPMGQKVLTPDVKMLAGKRDLHITVEPVFLTFTKVYICESK
jgi:hypothetical protein